MNEISRLQLIAPDNDSHEPLLATVRVRAPGFASEVHARCLEILNIVVPQKEVWPSVKEWRTILPNWFVNACADEVSLEEAERQRRLPLSQRQKVAQALPGEIARRNHPTPEGARLFPENREFGQRERALL